MWIKVDILGRKTGSYTKKRRRKILNDSKQQRKFHPAITSSSNPSEKDRKQENTASKITWQIMHTFYENIVL